MSYDLMVFEKTRAPKTKEEFMEWFEEQTHVQGNGKDGGSFVYVHRGRAGDFRSSLCCSYCPWQ